MRLSNPFKILSIGSVWTWLGLFAFIPILLVLITSLLTPDPDHLVKLQWTLHNYTQMVSGAYFRILVHSLVLALSTTALCLAIGYPFAFLISRSKSRYKPILLLLIIIPFWTSSLIRSYAIMTILKSKGLINTLLLGMGLIHHPLQILYSYEAVLIGTVYTLLPFMILPLYANLEKLDDTLLDAAKDLGATRITTFVRIIIPLTLPGITAGIMLVFLPAMTLFYIPVLLGGAKDLMLGNLIQNQFLIANNWPMGAATSIVVILLMIAMIALYRKVTRNDDQGFEMIGV